MSFQDLLFLASVLLELSLFVWMAVSAVRRQWNSVRRTARFAGLYLAGYATILIAAALLMPRRFLGPGERHCFDDWCVAAVTAEPSKTSAGSNWIVTLEVSSDAKRVRQRALDATAQLEDTSGRRYDASAAPLTPRTLSDQLGPGDSFRVLLPFRLPANARPAGVVVHHGAFPGMVIIGEDQSFLHPPALARVAIRNDK
jgi:hypothetical protein